MTYSAEAGVGAMGIGTLWVDLDGYRAEFAGRALALSRSQLELLGILLANAQRVVSRAELSQALGLSRGRSVDVLLSGLRRKVGSEFVRNVRGRGWIIEEAALGEASADASRGRVP